jgi:DNA invertase Pin-like site-specific DNA recombinase
MTKKAFSYARFSTSEQMDGRSLRRQEEAAKSYCNHHGLALDERSFRDLGVSGRKGANATHGELGDFLELIRDGRVPKGSVLVVENLDRITRLPPDEATALITGIVKAGVEVATTSPEQRYTARNIHEPSTWIPLQVAFCLAAEESRKKGERVADAWGSKRETAGTKKLTKKGPAWLKVTADRTGWIILEEKAKWVRMIFRLALEGHGVTAISGKMHKVAPEGMTGKGWQPAQVHALLRSRAVLGEYQPHTGTCAKKGTKSTRRPSGEPVKGYFPEIIDEPTFYRVQQLLGERLNHRKGGGRISGTPNLFSGLAYDAADGQKLVLNASNGHKVLVSAGAVRKLQGSVFRSIRYQCFEDAVLSLFKELKPADILAQPDQGKDKVAALSGRLTVLNAKIAQTKARAAQEDDATEFLDLLADLGRERREVIAAKEQAEGEAAARDADNLGEFLSLIDLLKDATPEELPELRRKSRARIKHLVRELWVLIVPRNQERRIAVQVHFRDGARRDYLIRTWAGGNGHNRGWTALSFADLASPDDFDLRNKKDVRDLEQFLVGLDLSALSETD